MFVREPPHRHTDLPKVGILLINLGTPSAPTPGAVRAYLKQFLSDPRVVELPRVLWWPLLHGVILNVRPGRSARKYAKIWTPEGSPLKVHTERQAQLLQRRLAEKIQYPVQVEWAMHLGLQLMNLPEKFAGMEVLKFQQLIRPGDEVQLHLRFDPARGKLYFAYRNETATCSSGRILLEAAHA